MKQFLYNNVQYKYDELVDWDLAIKVGGAYFARAKFLNISRPPAALALINEATGIDKNSNEYQEIWHEYDGEFWDGETIYRMVNSKEANAK